MLKESRVAESYEWYYSVLVDTVIVVEGMCVSWIAQTLGG